MLLLKVAIPTITALIAIIAILHPLKDYKKRLTKAGKFSLLLAASLAIANAVIVVFEHRNSLRRQAEDLRSFESLKLRFNALSYYYSFSVSELDPRLAGFGAMLRKRFAKSIGPNQLDDDYGIYLSHDGLIPKRPLPMDHDFGLVEDLTHNFAIDVSVSAAPLRGDLTALDLEDKDILLEQRRPAKVKDILWKPHAKEFEFFAYDISTRFTQLTSKIFSLADLAGCAIYASPHVLYEPPHGASGLLWDSIPSLRLNLTIVSDSGLKLSLRS